MLPVTEALARCRGTCRGRTPHRLSLFLKNGLWEITYFTCQGCKERRSRQLYHYENSSLGTACGLSLDPARRRFTTLRTQVDCPVCFQQVLVDVGREQVPDWRPEAYIAEDYYAG